MKNEMRLFDFKDKLPLNFTLIQFDSIFQHMHSYAELVIVLDGEFQCKINEEEFHCKQDDIFIVNPKVFHSAISDEKATVLSLFINQKGFGLTDDEINSHIFNLNTMKYGPSLKADEIRYLVYSIVKYNTMDNVNSIYTNRAIAYSMFAQLINKFSVDITEAEKKSSNIDIFNELAAFINDHYKENLTLATLAERFQYSTAYLSRLFKQSFHVTFLDYYTTVRVNYSVDDLLSTNKTIEDIASSHGFEDPRSYVRAFKSVFHDMYPSEYRRKFKNQNRLLDVASLSQKYVYLILEKYDEYFVSMNKQKTEKSYREEEISVDFRAKTSDITNCGCHILDVGSSRVFVYSELRQMISQLQEKIGFQYLVLRDLFNQTVRLFLLDKEGNYFFSESILENLLGFCKRNYFKPYFKFEFDFSSSLESFYLAIHSMVEYIRNHYEQSSYQGWLFCVTYTSSLGKRRGEDISAFFDIVIRLSQEIKNFLPGVEIATPSFLKEDVVNFSLVERFEKKAKDSDCLFDVLSIRFLEEGKNDFLQQNKDELKEFLSYLKRDDSIKQEKIFIEDFSFTNGDNLLNDTIFASSYLTKNLIDNITNISSLSKDAFFDSFGYEIQKNPFVGKSGIITYNGIKKATYNIDIFFSKLGTKILKRGKNFLVTLKGNKIILLLNNYVHYSESYLESRTNPIYERNRYSCFPEGWDLLFHFTFQNLDGDFARVKTSTISKKSGSAYDLSLNVGNFEDMKSEEIEEMKGLNYIYFSVKKEVIQSKKLNLDFTVSPLETKLIEIEIIKHML